MKTYLTSIEWWLKWGGTVFLLTATVATSFDVVPLNKILFLLGSLSWMTVGLMWRQPSMWVLNLTTSLLYIIGFIYN